jgi:hypothetical protein
MARVLPALCAIALAMLPQISSAEELNDLLGHHPHHGQDPYSTAMDQLNRPCCHGVDCMSFEGEVARVEGGWQMGPWFVADAKVIKIETLHGSVRGIHSICFASGRSGALANGAKATVRCGFPAQSGV